VEDNGRFFTQVNQSGLLSEFMNAVLSPLQQLEPAERVDVAELRQLLARRFSLGELRNLCFDLGVDYDDLPAEGKAEKARELVAYLERRERISELVAILRTRRPDVDWGDALGATSSN